MRVRLPSLSPVLMALTVLLASTGVAAAQEPAPPTDDTVDADEEPIAADDDFVLDEGEEVVHSWALTPAGLEAGGGGNRPAFSYTGDPGTVIEDALTVFNLGNEILTFRLYSTDAVNGADGQFALLPAGERPTDVGSWVEIAQELITVAPGRSATVPVTITIPDDAVPGDHSGGILASNEAFTTNEDGAAVVVERRTGSRLLLRVNGPLRSELVVQDLSVDYDAAANPAGGSTRVDFRIENRGNVRLDANAAVAVEGPFGIGRVTGSTASFPDLLPGQSVAVSQTIDGVAALGLVTAKVSLDAGDSGEGVTFTPVSRSASAFAPPITLILSALILLFGLLALRAYRRHDRAPVDAIVDVGRGVEIPSDVTIDEEELVR